MVKSNHFGSNLRPGPAQVDGSLPCVPGIHETFNMSADARC